MNTILILVSIFLVIIAGAVTVFAFKQEEKKMEEYKEAQLSPSEARRRSQEYEEKSISTVLPMQIWTYIIVTIVTVILIIVFAINY